MPELRNRRHEKFCQGVAKGWSYTEAYMRAGFKSTNRAASGRSAYRLRREHPEIIARCEELGAPRRGRIARDQVVDAIRTGRETTYREELNELARKYALLGLTEEEMADVFNISVPTLIDWKRRYPLFVEAINRGGINADAKVAERTYHRALGVRVPATKIFQHDGQIITHDYVEHYPPDTNAARLWLTNRQRARWKNREEVEHRTPRDELRERVEKMSREEQLAWMADVAERAQRLLEEERRTIDGEPIERDDEIPE